MRYSTRFALAALVVAGCAPKRSYVAAPVPEWDVVESMRLPAPAALPSSSRDDFETGWSALTQGRLEDAVDELEPLGERFGHVPEVATAVGFLELRLGNRRGAEHRFESALRAGSDYMPAEAGLVLIALAASDEELAYERVMRLEEDFPQHTLVDRYGMSLRVNVAESRLRRARDLAGTGQPAEAAEAYLEALEVAPEAGSLYLEAAEAELAADMAERAVIHARRATELEPRNAEAFRLLGEAGYATGDLAGSVDAYRRALELDPRDPELRSRLAAVEREYDREHLPPEYFAIPDAERVTREQLAALLHRKLGGAFDDETMGVIAMDITDSWASESIRRVAGAGVLEVFSNYMFQPHAYVTRIELARALASSLELVAPEAHSMALQSEGFEQDFPDLSRENLDYEAAALANSLGLLDPGPGGTFEPQRFVSGSEAVAAVEALAGHVTP